MSSIVAILIRTSLLLSKALLLIGILALLTPLWSFIFAGILLFIALFLCLVHCSGVVLGRTVDGDQLQRLVLGGVVELVLGACWDDYDVAGFDVLLFFYSISFSSPICSATFQA